MKKINVELDVASWPKSQPPTSLVAAQSKGQFDLDLDAALIFLAIWTRPPTRLGFTLADCWAWLRYFAAFQSGNNLQLCREWSDIDPHQKTVSSDDFGVGITTWFLHKTLGFQQYSDTNYVLKVLAPGMWTNVKKAKRGPSKSPDYIVKDGSGNLSILECKGTQSSVAELRNAIERGRPQKNNVKPAGGQRVLHKLVAGAFVPQAKSSERATILVCDPEWGEIEDEFSRHSVDDVRASTEQVAFAKEISIFDLNETSACLVGDLEQQSLVSSALDRDLEARTRVNSIRNNALTYERDHLWSMPIIINNDQYVGVRFKASLDLDFLQPLRPIVGEASRRERISEAISEKKWEHQHHDIESTLASPIGAKYEIEWLIR